MPCLRSRETWRAAQVHDDFAGAGMRFHLAPLITAARKGPAPTRSTRRHQEESGGRGCGADGGLQQGAPWHGRPALHSASRRVTSLGQHRLEQAVLHGWNARRGPGRDRRSGPASTRGHLLDPHTAPMAATVRTLVS